MKSTRILMMAFLLMCAIAASAKTYIVCVGLNQYDNGEQPLPCSRGDVMGIAKTFESMKDTDVFMLLDNNATRAHIMKVLERQFAKAGKNDEIIFAYSGHGFDGGISCYDSKNVIFCSEVQDIMARSSAGRKVMFINSCHSGSFQKKYKDSYNYKSKKSKVMLYMSSRANEKSWERSDMSMSFFFNNLVEGLKGAADKNGDRKVTARELFNFVNARVIRDTEGMQHPQMYGNFPDNMVIAVY